MAKNAVRILVIGAAGALLGGLLLPLGGSTTPVFAKGGDGDQADLVRFSLFVDDSKNVKNETVYCGVAEGGPYRLDATVSATPQDVGEGTGWLAVGLQQPSFAAFPEFAIDRFEFSVPFNDSHSFSLDLAGDPGVDQIVQLSSPPLGDEFGGGYPFFGLASVRASKGAVDPFDGDGRTDNFCVAIGGIPAGDFNSENPATWPTRDGVEFLEGEISTSLSVPDWWVNDGDGSDGGTLIGPFSPGG